MCCCSRPTLGLIIGGLNIVCYVVLIIISILFLNKLDSITAQTAEQENAIEKSRTVFICIIVFCLIMSILSGLLIMGIRKKYHKLILPWLIVAVIGYFFNIGHLIYNIIGAVSAGASLSMIFGIIIGGLIGFAISGIILWNIYKLYNDIRQENMEKPPRAHMTAEYAYQKSVDI